ncbi:hypothetical protein [Paenibacillus sp. GP183]|uniref:hypothetical protein n=1 Tax=Paenibacillus sp. GP183 TaxID=1882751 RepID=UPI000894F610|nr:hypothetical protein [Paenibacillus sp. GP183]SED12349.1 hypothetical protein SAMN05443246_5809 [Paenibacillus sp. GP183]
MIKLPKQLRNNEDCNICVNLRVAVKVISADHVQLLQRGLITGYDRNYISVDGAAFDRRYYIFLTVGSYD